MTITRSKLFYVEVGAAVLSAIALTFGLAQFDMPVIILLLVLMPVYLYLASAMIGIGRTFILDETGCTVCIGKYKKKYNWAQLKTKVIIKYYIPSMHSSSLYPPYETEIFFAPYKMRKPRIFRACTYSPFHPFRCIYMYFAPENSNVFPCRYYEVDEKEFITKMAQWGVELIEL